MSTNFLIYLPKTNILEIRYMEDASQKNCTPGKFAPCTKKICITKFTTARLLKSGSFIKNNDIKCITSYVLHWKLTFIFNIFIILQLTYKFMRKTCRTCSMYKINHYLCKICTNIPGANFLGCESSYGCECSPCANFPGGKFSRYKY